MAGGAGWLPPTPEITPNHLAPTPARVCALQAGWAWTPKALEWTQTALFKDGTTDLLKSMPPLVFMPMPTAPDGSPFLSVDASTTYQQILGFGGGHPPPHSHTHLRLDSLACTCTSPHPGWKRSGSPLTHTRHR